MFLTLFSHPVVIAVDACTLGLLTWLWLGGLTVVWKTLITLAVLLYLTANHWILWLWVERVLSGPPPPELKSGWYKQIFILGMLISGTPMFLAAGGWEVFEHRKRFAPRRSRPWRGGGKRWLLWLVAVGAIALMFLAAVIAVVVHTLVSGTIPGPWLAAAIGMGILIALTVGLGRGIR